MASTSSRSTTTVAASLTKKRLAESNKDGRLRALETKKGTPPKKTATETTPAETNKAKLTSSGAAPTVAASREQQQSTSTGRRKPGRPRKSQDKGQPSLPTRKRPYRAAAAKSQRPSDDQSNPVALLDMLAEVASATLEKDQSIKTQTKRRNMRGGSGKPYPEVTSRSVGGTASVSARAGETTTPMSAATRKAQKRTNGGDTVPDQHLSLDQIRMLPDKMLLLYFSELTADEIRRNYSYVCRLVPDKCQQKYTSFGNENRARMQMKSHLLSHIAELLADANIHGRSPQKNRFTAEPVPVRKRRLMNVQQQVENVALQKRRSVGGEPRIVSKGGPKSLPTKKWKPPTILKRKPSAANKQDEKEMAKMMDSAAVVQSESVVATAARRKRKVAAVINAPKRRRYVKVLLEDVVEEVIVENDNDDEEDESKLSDDDDDGVDQHYYNEQQQQEQQYHHDHSYTTADGGKNLPDHFKGDEGEYVEDDFDDDDCETATVVVGDVNLAKGIVIASTNQSNMTTAPSTASNQPTKFRSKQAEMALRQLEAIRLLQIQKNKKLTSTSTSYSSAMATEIAAEAPNVVRIDVGSLDEQEEQRGYEDDTVDFTGETASVAAAVTYDSDVEKEESSPDRGSPEWERKLALKYIRMLRLKKKDEHVPLVCRICEGQKCFTAQATLMYHYRSHAGIKPFVCAICQTTFTRQHSLNYHMLIHNNKSRFTCGDCGRQFRHPSHFKEHLRRHTGETPFECTDCGVRFKTRNTYKRHLKTRHGKLLTVNGIIMLSTEEFMKVKTNPKKRTPRLPKREAGYDSNASGDDIVVAAATTPTIEEDADDEDAIAARSLEQRDIVQAAVEAIMQEEAQQQQQQHEKVDTELAEQCEGEVSYTFYSIGVGTDPLNGKEIIVLEAVPQSGMQQQLQLQQQSPSDSAVAASLQSIVQCT